MKGIHRTRPKRKHRVVIALAIGVGAIAAVAFFSLFLRIPSPSSPIIRPSPPATDRAFSGDSRELKATKVVATLDTPLQKKSNSVWCASFLAAWKTMEDELGGEPKMMRTAGPDNTETNDGLSARDVLLIPDIVWRITHRFTEIEGRKFTNTGLKGQKINLAWQDIQFRLTRTGAELRSDAGISMLSLPAYYLFNRPFLIFMKKRDAQTPYFVMWIDNAELLCKWAPGRD